MTRSTRNGSVLLVSLACGFTVLTAVGAQPDLRIIAKHCAGSPEFVCDPLRFVNSPYLNADSPTIGDAFLPDLRIKAAVVAAPGLGFTLVPHGLDNVRVPIQLWGTDSDINVPYATNTELIREALGSRVEFHPVAGAVRFSFLTPCGLLGPPEICSDPGQFDRKAFHTNMNASVIAFFENKHEKSIRQNVPTTKRSSTLHFVALNVAI